MSCLCRASAQTRVPLLCILTSGVTRGGTEAYRPDSRVCVCVCVSVPVILTLTLTVRLSLAAAAVTLRPLPGCVHTGSWAEAVSWDQWENRPFPGAGGWGSQLAGTILPGQRICFLLFSRVRLGIAHPGQRSAEMAWQNPAAHLLCGFESSGQLRSSLAASGLSYRHSVLAASDACPPCLEAGVSLSRHPFFALQAALCLRGSLLQPLPS